MLPNADLSATDAEKVVSEKAGVLSLTSVNPRRTVTVAVVAGLSTTSIPL